MGKPSKGSDTGSKSDKKFEKKLQFYTKVRDTLASLSVQKEIGKKKKIRSRQKKLKAYDLSTLSEFLPEFSASQKSDLPAPDLKMNCKRRQELVLTEGERLNKVLEHPAFQADPMGSIFQHLQSQQPPPVEEKPKKKANTNGSKKRNRKNKGKAESMDF